MAKKKKPSKPSSESDLLQPATGHEPRLTKFQGFTPERVARHQLNPAPYNPRQIDPYAEKRLRQGIKDNGLVETLTWNRRTGYLVSGHQRLSQIDKLEGSLDYAIDVSVIDVDDRTERRLNALLNNPNVQGSYDVPKLIEMALDEEHPFDFEGAGFDHMDMQVLFEGTEHAEKFAGPGAPKAPGQEAASEEAEEQVADLDEISKMKRAKREHREKFRAGQDDTEFYAVIVFRSMDEKERFMEKMGLPHTERYVSADRVLAHTGPLQSVEEVDARVSAALASGSKKRTKESSTS